MESMPLLSLPKRGGRNNNNTISRPIVDGPIGTRRRNGLQHQHQHQHQNQHENKETYHNTKHFGMKLSPNHNNKINDSLSLSCSSFSSSGNYNIYPPNRSAIMTKEDDSIKRNQQHHDHRYNPHNLSLLQRMKTSAKILKGIIPKHGLDIHGHGQRGRSHNGCDDDDGDNDEHCTNNNNDLNDYYEDNFNEYSWKCTFGRSDDDGIWMNTNDISGTIMATMVWIMILYSSFTVTILAQNNAMNSIVATIYCTLCALALASHAKTTFTDPGSIPKSAIPNEQDGINCDEFPMCAVCETYKPKQCHHCRICNRCISGMDHHCPWMNNCIGRGNMKHFILFLVYVWLASAYALSLFALNYFLCNNRENCEFPDVLVQLVRIMTVLCIGALCFTSNMIMNVLWGLFTGLSTIDRMKMDEFQINLVSEAYKSTIPWKDVFGIQHFYTWFLPIDPVFEDYDKVMGYRTVPRLIREKNVDMKSIV